jgi:hypothetical protein
MIVKVGLSLLSIADHPGDSLPLVARERSEQALTGEQALASAKEAQSLDELMVFTRSDRSDVVIPTHFDQGGAQLAPRCGNAWQDRIPRFP